MPGRGRFWEVGALNDEIVEESDLVQELQTKVNAVGGTGHTIEDEGTPLSIQPDLNFKGAGVTVTNDSENTATVVTIPGGGNVEFLGETILTVAAQPITVTFASPALLSDFSHFEAIFVGTMNTSQSSIGWRINGLAVGYKNNYLEWISNPNSVLAGGKSDTGSLVGASISNSKTAFERLIIQGLANIASKIFLQGFGHSDDLLGPPPQTGGIAHQNFGWVDTTATSITSVEMNGLSEDFAVGAKVMVFGFKK